VSSKEIVVTDFAKTGGNLGGILHQSKHRDSMIPLTEKYDRI
tara:strand:- start:2199 stop:2324 length:126 start_codon:yes stop_codon:yes gene_type:complete